MIFSVLTVSDSCFRGERLNESGPAARAILEEELDGFYIDKIAVVPDEEDAIFDKLVQWCDKDGVDLVLTTGGTGLGPRDVTPEATMAVCQKLAPGLAEMIRREGCDKTPRAALSRGVVGVRRQTLVINLPGSLKGVLESLKAVRDILPHAIRMVKGEGHRDISK